MKSKTECVLLLYSTYKSTDRVCVCVFVSGSNSKKVFYLESQGTALLLLKQ